MVGLFKYPKRKMKKLLKDGEYDEAITFGKSLESEYSEDHDFMFIMGSAYFIVEDAEKALPYLSKALQEDSAMVRAHAVWALNEIGTAKSLDFIAEHAPKETDPEVLEELKLVNLPEKS